MDEFLRDFRAVSIPLRGMQTNRYGVIGALILNSFKTLMTKRRKRDEKEKGENEERIFSVIDRDEV
jgi:hypothetical protein